MLSSHTIKTVVERVVSVYGGYRPAAHALGMEPQDATTLHDILNGKSVSYKRKRHIWRKLESNDVAIEAWLNVALEQLNYSSSRADT